MKAGQDCGRVTPRGSHLHAPPDHADRRARRSRTLSQGNTRDQQEYYFFSFSSLFHLFLFLFFSFFPSFFFFFLALIFRAWPTGKRRDYEDLPREPRGPPQVRRRPALSLAQ